MNKRINYFSFLICGLLISKANLMAAPSAVDLAIKDKIEAAFRDVIKSKISAEDSELAIQVSSLQVRPMIDVHKWKEVQVFGVGITGTGLQGMFSLPVQVVTLDGKYISANAFGSLDVTAPVFVTTREIKSNETIGEEGIQRQILPWKFLSPGFMPLPKEQILGRRTRVRLGQGSAFYSEILDEPLAVKSGESVSLTLISGPGVLIRSRAVARSSGRIGDRIKVLNPQTQKQMEVVVTAEKEVEVSL